MNNIHTKATRVDATGTVRRLRALVAIGHSQTELAKRLGVFPTHVSLLIHGKQSCVTPATYSAVMALFTGLWAHPVQSPAGARSRAIAKAHGWVGPLAWDDIDDPTEKPNLRGVKPRKDPEKKDVVEIDIDEIAVERAMRGERVTLTRAERLHAITKLHDRRWSDRRIGMALHINERTVLRNRQGMGLESFEFSEIRQVDSA